MSAISLNLPFTWRVGIVPIKMPLMFHHNGNVLAHSRHHHVSHTSIHTQDAQRASERDRERAFFTFKFSILNWLCVCVCSCQSHRAPNSSIYWLKLVDGFLHAFNLFSLCVCERFGIPNDQRWLLVALYSIHRPHTHTQQAFETTGTSGTEIAIASSHLVWHYFAIDQQEVECACRFCFIFTV